jgi:hypothetical protein
MLPVKKENPPDRRMNVTKSNNRPAPRKPNLRRQLNVCCEN